MPATRKHAIKGMVQGYTDIMLRDDLALLPKLRTVSDGVVEYDEDVTKLRLGRACAKVYTPAEASLKALFTKLKKLLPDSVVKTVTKRKEDPNTGQQVEYQADVDSLKFVMGPLKKVSRITAKAVHYAVCDKDNHAQPQLQMVRDILRATMVFPPDAWGDKEDRIGTKMIDTIDDHFGGAVIQVKNRFIHGRYPNYAQLSGVELPEDLAKYVEETAKQTLWGRDSFYRDLQLLVRLDNAEFDNGEALGHVILELQLASSKMYSGKTHKDANGVSGHDMYKNVRAVSEYVEYLYWTKLRANKLPKAEDYYDTNSMNFPSFIEQSQAMADMYQAQDLKRLAEVLANAIDDSEWFAANREK